MAASETTGEGGNGHDTHNGTVCVGTLRLHQPLCVGTMQWGTTRLDHKLNRGMVMNATLDAMLDTMAQHRITFMDTAEGYGGGSSEERVGCAMDRFVMRRQEPQPSPDKTTEGTRDGTSFVVGSKFLPTLWRMSRAALLASLRNTLHRLGKDSLELYMLHTPTHPASLELWIDALCDAMDAGLVQNIGVSNCDASQVRRACAAAKRRGHSVAVNQVLFCLLDYASPKLQHMERVCREEGVTIMGYGPLVCVHL